MRENIWAKFWAFKHIKTELMEKLIIIIGAVGLIIGLAIVFTWSVQWLWNNTVPEVLGLKALTFWQTFRLELLCGILFKGTSSTSK